MTMLDMYRAKRTIISNSPNDFYKDNFQALIDDRWEETTQLINVKEEYPVGSFKFKDTECRIQRGRDRSIGIKTGDDFRELVFKDIDYDTHLGRYYIFDDRYWLTVNTDSTHRTDNDVIVRKCNNWLRWKVGDRVLSYPIVAEYDVSKGTPRLNSDISTPTNTISIIVQANEETLKLGVNWRFILSGRPFKLNSLTNYLMTSTTGKQEILYMEVSLDEISPYDDFANGLAYNGDIIAESDVGEIEIPIHEGLCVEPWFDSLRQNYSKEIEANLWVGGVKQDSDVTVSATGAPIWAYEVQSIDHNKWLVTCKNPAQIPLQLTFECDGESKDIMIALDAMF